MVWDYLNQHHPDGSTRFDPEFDAVKAASALDTYVSKAVGAERAASIDKQLVFDLAARGLLEAAQTATLLVLGARGLGGFKELLVGSVTQRCLREAACPVAVVHDASDESTAEHGRIVVGVDGSKYGQAALKWAAREASLRHAKLRVVHAFRAASVDISFLPEPVSIEQIGHKEGRAVLESAVMSAKLPDSLDVELLPETGSPAKALLEASIDADLIVVGRVGRSLLRGLTFGSVATQISHHSKVPAVLVNRTEGPVLIG